jgi:hypothetical protein
MARPVGKWLQSIRPKRSKRIRLSASRWKMQSRAGHARFLENARDGRCREHDVIVVNSSVRLIRLEDGESVFETMLLKRHAKMPR